MRILIVGAGGVGGYFGGRLLALGRDVTFLVRARRQAQLNASGLVIESPMGDLTIAAPTVLAEDLSAPFDVVILSTKAYDLDDAITALAPAIDPGTFILPLLNGMRHLDALEDRFGAEKIMGGYCSISSTVSPEGHILHLNRLQTIVFGARSEGQKAMSDAIARQFEGSITDWQASDCVQQGMWEKWIFLSVLATSTCLMRASIGQILGAGGKDLIVGMLAESQAAATACGHGARPQPLAGYQGLLTDPASTLTASMMRDMEHGSRTEAEHIVGDLISRGEAHGVSMPLMRLALTHLRAYDLRRAATLSG